MNLDMVARTIQLVLAPVVMVTTAALILNGVLGRYSAVNDRLRVMALERLELLRTAPGDPLARQRLELIDAQLPELLHRHRIIQQAAFAVYLAMLGFVVTMFVLGLAVATAAAAVATAALLLFLAGTAALLAALVLQAFEVYRSHHAVSFEVEQVAKLRL